MVSTNCKNTIIEKYQSKVETNTSIINTKINEIEINKIQSSIITNSNISTNIHEIEMNKNISSVFTTQNCTIETKCKNISLCTNKSFIFTDSLYTLDLNKKIHKPKIYLFTPQKKFVCKINNLYELPKLKIVVGGINELSFKILYDIIDRKKNTKNSIRNEEIDKIKDKYYIKIEYNNIEEWFIITKIKDSSAEDGDCREIECIGLPMEINNSIYVTDYHVVSYKLIEMLKGKPFDKNGYKGLLRDSLWSVGYIDEDIANKYRSADISMKKGIDIINTLCETFDCIPIYDTNKRIIHFYSLKNVGKITGLVLNYGKYLNTLDKESISDEIVTRLIVRGKDGLTINNVNPTGESFIDDYSFYLHPFEMDLEGNVVKSSDYMSDDLCKAILNYQIKVAEHTGEFYSLLTKSKILNQLLIAKEIELQQIKDLLQQMKDNVILAIEGKAKDVRKYYESEVKKIEEQINKYITQIIEPIREKIKRNQKDIIGLKEELKEENNFTAQQLHEKQLFITQDVYLDNNISNSEDLFFEGKKYFDKIKKPKTTFTIDIVNFLEIVGEQRNWDKLRLGDIITIIYKKFNTKIEARIMEIEFDFDNNNINLIISTVKDYSDKDELINILYKNISLQKEIEVSKIRWDGITKLKKTVDDILNNPWEMLNLDELIKNELLEDTTNIYDELEEWIDGFKDDLDLLIDEKLEEIELPKNVIVEVFKEKVISAETIHALNAWIKNLFVEYIETNFDAIDPRNPSQPSVRNYITVKDQNIKMITSDIDPTQTVDFMIPDPSGNEGMVNVYYTSIGDHPDAYKYFTITSPLEIYPDLTEEEVDAFKVKICRTINEKVKAQLGFINDGLDVYPKFIMGAGWTSNPNDNRDKGFIYKLPGSFVYEYIDGYNISHRIVLNDKGNGFHVINNDTELPYRVIWDGTTVPDSTIGKDGDLYVQY